MGWSHREKCICESYIRTCCALIMWNEIFLKKTRFCDSFDITKCLQQIKRSDLLHNVRIVQLVLVCLAKWRCGGPARHDWRHELGENWRWTVLPWHFSAGQIRSGFFALWNIFQRPLSETSWGCLVKKISFTPSPGPVFGKQFAFSLF